MPVEAKIVVRREVHDSASTDRGRFAGATIMQAVERILDASHIAHGALDLQDLVFRQFSERQRHDAAHKAIGTCRRLGASAGLQTFQRVANLVDGSLRFRVTLKAHSGPSNLRTRSRTAVTAACLSSTVVASA